ncbi:head completion/stabilization protein [Novosphingobium sp.]|uniref:head completion/stabilization protein n=1 Tax=Novosphingobium sp. TaxID=1874826 RepID=UPI001EB1FAEC|nr:head completion/stabilization protein [Novosphingobium sp.]MBK6801638.1 head completion/stabilization protein [Novosphingobium sp.]MBK9009994.1 head completion/stabilization protein [Novosphingobium sp.]
MSTPLVAVPSPPASPTGTTVAADDFFPEIDCLAVRDALRLSDAVTHVRLVEAIRGGLITVLDQLTNWRAARLAEGYANLSEIEPDRIIDDATRLEHLFQRAVRFYAAAELAELHRDVSATEAGQARADIQLLTAADYRRLGIQAVRDMLGTSRIAVELI